MRKYLFIYLFYSYYITQSYLVCGQTFEIKFKFALNLGVFSVMALEISSTARENRSISIHR